MKVRTRSQTILVVTDIRFQNEADLIRKNGGILVRIERKPVGLFARWGLALRRRFNDHPSESNTDKIRVDRVIDNSGSLESLVLHAEGLIGRCRED